MLRLAADLLLMFSRVAFTASEKRVYVNDLETRVNLDSKPGKKANSDHQSAVAEPKAADRSN